ncbi:YaaC family protein [Scopulibacillus cellulosilyticus]|uniref:YaaC family protein n=2 Tax=Scopulibacillus cellulosilyticus TaxID=2665665 RepID=A0ABW2Q6L6_9BACL
MENIFSIWSNFYPYLSVHYSQHYLKNCYENQNLPEPAANSYKNGYPFCYYLQHGKMFYLQAEQAPYELKPVLLFYGMIQLLKAWLLTADVDYPDKANVLAHGVSSRKKKKYGYAFFDDAVRIQKTGLFSHLAKLMFHMKPLEGKKYCMGLLLKNIPELNELFKRMKKKAFYHPLIPKQKCQYILPINILDEWHMTVDRFCQNLNKYGISCSSDKNLLILKLKKELTPIYADPFQYSLTGDYMVSCSKERVDLPEILVHYIILYNLSMISRYETEWWYELHYQKSSPDLSFIHAFLDVTAIKIPFFISHYLGVI